MTNTVLGEIYFSLSNQELRLLDQYISTSNWQYSDTVVKCHECMQFHKLQDSLDTLTKEEIFRYIYEEEEHNDSKLRFLFNRLIEAIREFILLYQNKQTNVFADKIWSDFLLNKKLKKNIQYNLEKKESKTTSEYRFLNHYFKSQIKNIHSFSATKDIKFQFETIHQLMKNAELFSDLVFIKNYCSLISFSNVYQSTPIDLPIAKFQEIKDKKWGAEHPEFLVYLSLIDILLNRSDIESYMTYKQNVFNHLSIWEKDEIDNLLTYLLNFTTGQINKGNSSFIDEQYELFTSFIDSNLYYTADHITSSRVNNTIFIFLRKKEFIKAEEFIFKYIELLDPKIQSSCKHFNLARIYFENFKYKESLRELLQVDFGQESFYSINSKIILLKNYYELKESDAFDSLCSSFKELVRKNKVVSESHKMSIINFIKSISKLYGATPSKVKKLKVEIEANTQLAEKNWLLEKCL